MSVEPVLLGLISLAFAMAVQLGGFSFLLGGLFQRVKSNGARIHALETGERSAGDGQGALKDRVTRLETQVQITLDQQSKSIEGLSREVHGLSRQLSALTTQNRRGVAPPMADANSMGD